MNFANWKTECAVVIPCLNEETTIFSVVEHVRSKLPRVIVVDDGSTDKTARRAANAGAEIIRHPFPLGKGAALAAGWKLARESGYCWVLMMDGDGQHSAEEIPALLCEAEKTGAEMIIGNRMWNPAGMPMIRRMVNRWMSWRLSRDAGLDLPDSQCGLRLARLDVLCSLPGCARHFEVESDVLLGFIARGCAIRFVPIQTIYQGGGSKIHPIRDTVRWFRWWMRARGEFKTLCLRDTPPKKHALAQQSTCKLSPPKPSSGRAL